MKTAYLHIGSPKTGTTAIQTMYGMNPHFLTEAGISFPPFSNCLYSETPNTYAGNGSDLLRLAYNFSLDIDDYLQNLFSDSDKIFISYEAFIKCYPEHINFLCNAFLRNNIKLHVIIVFRNLYDYFFSLWKQNVYFGYRHSFPEYVVEKKDLNIFSTFRDYKFSLNCPFLALENFKKNKNIEITALHYDSIKNILLEKFSQILGTRHAKTSKNINSSINYFDTEIVRCITNKIHTHCSFSEKQEFFFAKIVGNMAKVFANSSQTHSQEREKNSKPFYKSVLHHLVHVYDSAVQKLNNEYNLSLQIVTPDEKFCQPIIFDKDTHTAELVQQFCETLDEKLIR